MTNPINITLYRLLVKQGANEAEAEEAARIDASSLATKADVMAVKADLAELKVDLLKWTVAIVWSALGLQTVLMYFLLNRLVP